MWGCPDVLTWGGRGSNPRPTDYERADPAVPISPDFPCWTMRLNAAELRLKRQLPTAAGWLVRRNVVVSWTSRCEIAFAKPLQHPIVPRGDREPRKALWHLVARAPRANRAGTPSADVDAAQRLSARGLRPPTGRIETHIDAALPNLAEGADPVRSCVCGWDAE